MMGKCMTSGLMGRSDTTTWETPQDLFDRLDREFHFDLDVCASDGCQRCESYFAPQTDGLRQSWAGHICFMNPPYGSEIKDWVKKAAAESERAVVVALLPGRTDTKWFQQYVLPYVSEIRLVAGRVRFRGAKSGAPFPSVIAVYGPLKPKCVVCSAFEQPLKAKEK